MTAFLRVKCSLLQNSVLNSWVMKLEENDFSFQCSIVSVPSHSSGSWTLFFCSHCLMFWTIFVIPYRNTLGWPVRVLTSSFATLETRRNLRRFSSHSRLWDLYWGFRLSNRRSHKPRRDGSGVKFFLVCKAASWRSLIILFLVVVSGAEATYRSWQQWFGSRMVPRGSCCRCAGSQWTFCVSLSSMAGQERGRWQNRERASSR